MRREPTEAETILWHAISEDRLGVRFRRQHVIGDYIVDFVCLSKSLIIEIDGGYHNTDEQKTYDTLRTEWLELQGFTVIRFTNEQVLNNLEQVLHIIQQMLK